MPHSHASLLDRIDPRSRIMAMLALTLLTALLNSPRSLLAALAVAALCTAISGLRPATVLRRMVPVNLFMLLLIALMPLTSGGREIGRLGPLSYGKDGLHLALTIAIKGNAIVLMLVALLGSLDINTVGHAMNHLRVPDKLTHLLLFTVRYLDVLRREYGRLNAAMRLRGFRPGANMHTYRTYGHLIGMLLVRSLDRSERVVAAMKCRGFRGHFYLLDHFHYSRLDMPFALVLIVVLTGLAWLEWL
ncbi:MAG: cobalt ECF transporter T component CbiQ [Rhodopirellula sp.]|nr:cobalt ECF transporter T component CbiQ [Rhodopirellula sp.]